MLLLQLNFVSASFGCGDITIPSAVHVSPTGTSISTTGELQGNNIIIIPRPASQLIRLQETPRERD